MSKAKFVTELKGKESTQKSPPPLNICIVINVLYYLKPFSKVITLAEPLDNIGSDIERTSFLALKQILTLLESGKNDPINIYPFLDKFCHVTSTNLHEFECLDVSFIWDSVIKLVTVVIPPLREVFLGRISSSFDIPGWLNLVSRCFHAQFLHPTQTLDEVIRATLLNYVHDEDEEEDEDADDDSELYDQKSPGDRLRGFNAKILYRAPEILVFAVESTHLPLPLRFTDMYTRATGKAKPPNAIRFPESFDVSMYLNECNTNNNILPPEGEPDNANMGSQLEFAPKWYDLTSVVTLDGAAFDNVQAYYRCLDREDSQQWMEGSGAHHEEVDKTKVIEGNYFSSTDARKVHPRLLIYTKRGMFSVLERLSAYVTKAGQMRSLGDATFESAETPEHYDEAKHYYEEAIAYDANLRPVLQERLTALELIERNQRAHCYETQADISLGRRRFKEACDLYKSAMRSAVTNSPLYLRIREKEDYMMKIISLEIANHLTEKGQDCLKSGCFAQGKEHFLQAMKLNPSYIHLQTIISGIDQAITVQSSAQKVTEANQAMKLGKYKQANQLFQESIALIPEREAALKSVLESLVGLMQGEEALIKQRAGLVALEDKKYILAIDFITEAIALLPAESVMEHAFFLCDRAQVYFEMKEYTISIEDCMSALALRPDLAMGYLRLGAAQFELERYDDAIESYERAIRNDGSLADQVKVKMRQVNTAKEILQRKEREAERARIKEEEKRMLEEKRARDEAAKKSRQQKLAQEQAEKSERGLMREEELLMQKVVAALKASALLAAAEAPAGKDGATDASKDNGKNKKDKEKSEKELQKAQERERVRQEKEKERERVKLEKEKKVQEEKRLKEEELQRQKDFTAEMERAQNRSKEIEREKEVEREKARIERERVIAEREKAREEKLAEAKKTRNTAKPVPAPPTSPVATNPASAQAASATAAAAELFPSIFAGAAKVTVKLNNKAGSVTPTPEPSTPTPAAPSTPGPGAKWSSILTPANPVASPAGTSTKATQQAQYNPYTNNRNRGNSMPDNASDFPPLGESVQEQDAKNKGGYQSEVGFQYGGVSSAWADHERAMLEATAERISVSAGSSKSQTASSGSAVPSSGGAPPAGSSSSSSDGKRSDAAQTGGGGEQTPGGTLVPTPKTSSLAVSGEYFNSTSTPPVPELSPLMSKLGIGGPSGPPGGHPASGGLIQRTHMATENDDNDINLLLSSSLEPLPASPGDHFAFGLHRGAHNGDQNLNSLLGGPLGLDNNQTGFGMNNHSLERALSGNYGGQASFGIDNYASLLGPATLNNDSSSLLGGNSFGLLQGGNNNNNSLYPQSNDIGSSLLSGNSLYGNSGGESSLLNFLGQTNSSNLLPARGNSGLDSLDPSFSLLGVSSTKSHSSELMGSRGNSGGFGGDLDLDSLGLGVGAPLDNSLSSLLSYNHSSHLGGSEFGGSSSSSGGFGFGSDSSNGGSLFSGLAFPEPQRAASGGMNFGLNNGMPPLSRHSSSSPFMSSPATGASLSGLLHPPTPPLMNLAPPASSFASLMDFPPNGNGSALGGLGGINTNANASLFGIAENTTLSKGIDNDVVPEGQFPSVAWLRMYHMHMYRWAGNTQEWTDYAMHVPREMFGAVFTDDGSSMNSAVSDVSRRSGCKMWKETEFLRGMSESFLVFHKGSDGQPSHQAMFAALELFSTLLRQWIAGAASAAAPRAPTPVAAAVTATKPPVDSFLGAVVQPAPTPAPTSARAASSGATFASTAGANAVALSAAAAAAAVAAGTAIIDENGAVVPKRERPPLLKVAPLPASGYLQRYLEIPRDVVGLIIGQGGKKIKELCTESGAKIQFRVNKTAEREGRPGLLEVHGSQDNVDKALHLIWDLLQLLGKDYNEVPHNTNITKSTK